MEFIIKAEGKRDALIKKHAETSAAIRKKRLPRTPAEERAEQSYGQFKVPTLATDSHRHWRVARKIDLGLDNATEVTETPHYTSTAALPPQEKDTVRLQTRHWPLSETLQYATTRTCSWPLPSDTRQHATTLTPWPLSEAPTNAVTSPWTFTEAMNTNIHQQWTSTATSSRQHDRDSQGMRVEVSYFGQMIDCLGTA